ncbi:hypothetical protein RHSIM_Rhsim08G0080000 [Rhododendron simsii]|uniref:protein-S-isoprenylcysteine alpha-carbonyl methylesterase n=1 Tax=Rhododendron simsii TaxID=118357 RepID=A0A834GNH3_RHOSS|nr:hypothetical protein RHSIM_Rhsim08G0080000 [Rhododendron simsii]
MTTSPPPIQTNRVQTVQSLVVDDDKKDDTQPLIARASTYPRRRPSTLRSPPLRQRSLTRNIGHAASETYLVTGLAFKLLAFLGVLLVPLIRWRKVFYLVQQPSTMPSSCTRHVEDISIDRTQFCEKETKDLYDEPSSVDVFDSIFKGRLPVDLESSFPMFLCNVTYARLSPRYLHITISSQAKSGGVLFMEISLEIGKRSELLVIYSILISNRLPEIYKFDLYLPKNSDGPKPVLAFVTGGAWIIGYKAWGSLLGKQLAERDIIVACFDYRNFPQGTISDMVEDVLQGISFVCNNIVDYGGDPNRIYLMGQSAGAHISSCALLEQAVKESEGGSISWSVSQIKAYFGLSGGYNIPSLVEHFHRRGLYRSVFLSIMEGEKLLQHFSPEIRIQDPRICNAVAMLPQIILFHGTSDYSIPSDASRAFADALQRVGAKVELILYSGKTHTDLFLHDPLRGGKDELFDYVVAFIHAGDKEALAKDAVAPPRPRLLPEFLLQLARQVSPF